MSDRIEVLIDSLAFGGAGVGSVVQADSPELVGIRAFVAETAPGDLVLIGNVRRKKNHLEAEALEYLSFSNHRVRPRCEHFGSCGGCHFQHIAYPESLKFKREMVLRAIGAGGLVRLYPELDWSSIVGEVRPGPPYAYRRRASLHVENNEIVGFKRRFSDEIIDIGHCPILTESLQAKFAETRELLKKLVRVFGGANVKRIELEEIAKQVYLTFYLNNSSHVGGSQHADELPFGTPLRVVAKGGELYKESFSIPVMDSLLGRGVKLCYSPSAFSQVGDVVNSDLVTWVLLKAKEFFASDKGDLSEVRALDLYAGAGNFALPLASLGAEVVAVELDGRLVRAGERSAKESGLDNRLKFVETSTERFLGLAGSGSKRGRKGRRGIRETVGGEGSERSSDFSPNFIVADPPRSGLGECYKGLLHNGVLILVSCHLPSLVRDLKNLLSDGWKVEEIAGFDMFAQTTYTELVTVLTR